MAFLTFLVPFQIPTSEPVSFEAVFGSNLSEDTRNMLSTATAQRKQFLESLTYEGARPDPRNVIAMVDAYIPTAFHILHSLEAHSSDEIVVKSKFNFSWTSVFSCEKKYSKKS